MKGEGLDVFFDGIVSQPPDFTRSSGLEKRDLFLAIDKLGDPGLRDHLEHAANRVCSELSDQEDQVGAAIIAARQIAGDLQEALRLVEFLADEYALTYCPGGRIPLDLRRWMDDIGIDYRLFNRTDSTRDDVLFIKSEEHATVFKLKMSSET